MVVQPISSKQQVSVSAGTPAFSFKDAVMGSLQVTEPLPLQHHAVKPAQVKKDKKHAMGPHLIRSRSITKIVESSRFKKRCEALQAHYGRQRHDTKEEGARSLSFSPRASRDMRKKVTPLEELSEREQGLHSSSERETKREGVSRLAASSSEKVDGTSQESGRPRPTDRRRGSMSPGAASGSITHETLADSLSDKSSAQERKGSELSEERRCGIPVFSQASTGACSDKSELSHSLAVECATTSRPFSQKVVDCDEGILDFDDTDSESTAESSCPSPHPSPHSHFGSHRLLDADVMDANDDMNDLLHGLSTWNEEDEEAYVLLDQINDLSAEFVASREYEESNALTWSVQQAAQRGIISTSLQQNLVSIICEGNLDEARDVLYHKCHLMPAVGSVVESSTQPTMDAKTLQSFEAYVNYISPTDVPEARMHKLNVLKQLSDLLTMWVKMVGRERNLTQAHIALTKGSLFLAGSYRLGLDDPNSDIDAVCVAPWHVTHDDFFTSFCRLLEQTSGVTQLAPVPNAYMPLISLSIFGVRMDLLFARLPVSSVEANQNIDSDHMLIGVQETSMKALNAPRVSSMLLCLVPKRREYRIVLRAVRAWARLRGVYSAKLGYLGGISWAIMVAFVCQMYPNAEPAKVFVRFFQVFSEWRWPQPVMLNMIYDAGLGFDMWDPRQNVFDRSHIMPIITPAYPHMNSSVQVSQSTFSVIYEELWRARYLAEIAVGMSKPYPMTASSTESLEADAAKVAMVCGPRPVPMNVDELNQCGLEGIDAEFDAGAWDQLFQSSNFFLRYNSYMVFNFKADTDGAMHKWGKFVQSRIRKLVDNLNHMPPVSRVHAFPCYFPHTYCSERTSPGSCMFIGIEFHCRQQERFQPKEDPEVKKTLEQTIRFFLATDLQQMEDKQPDMTADAIFLSWEELPDFVFCEGRSNAEFERAQYTRDLETMGYAQGNTPSFRPPYYVNSYNRNGKGRNGTVPRKYAGGQRKQRRESQNAVRSFSGTQAG